VTTASDVNPATACPSAIHHCTQTFLLLTWGGSSSGVAYPEAVPSGGGGEASAAGEPPVTPADPRFGDARLASSWMRTLRSCRSGRRLVHVCTVVLFLEQTVGNTGRSISAARSDVHLLLCECCVTLCCCSLGSRLLARQALLELLQLRLRGGASASQLPAFGHVPIEAHILPPNLTACRKRCNPPRAVQTAE
jgi:hypothetical protein